MARFLVVLDVDSTLIEQEVIELLAEEAGVLEEVAEIAEAKMLGWQKIRSFRAPGRPVTRWED